LCGRGWVRASNTHIHAIGPRDVTIYIYIYIYIYVYIGFSGRSQLWLLKLNEGAAAEESLRREAERLGLRDPGRLFFTGSADMADHVAYKV
jgi:hypothetical protein